MNCPICGSEVAEGDKFCSTCGAAVTPEASGFIMATTPTIQGTESRRFWAW